jgi:hypothetical protein
MVLGERDMNIIRFLFGQEKEADLRPELEYYIKERERFIEIIGDHPDKVVKPHSERILSIAKEGLDGKISHEQALMDIKSEICDERIQLDLRDSSCR